MFTYTTKTRLGFRGYSIDYARLDECLNMTHYATVSCQFTFGITPSTHAMLWALTAEDMLARLAAVVVISNAQQMN